MWIPNTQMTLEQHGFELHRAIEKYPHMSGPTQFKLTLFKSQLYLSPVHINFTYLSIYLSGVGGGIF